MICQGIDTIIFVLVTYIGVMSMKNIFEIMISMYIFKVFIAILDTPFMYIASKSKTNCKD